MIREVARLSRTWVDVSYIAKRRTRYGQKSLFTWTVCGMPIAVSHLIELAITIRVVSVSVGNDQRNRSARTNIHTQRLWSLCGVLHVAYDPAFLRSALGCEEISSQFPNSPTGFTILHIGTA